MGRMHRRFLSIALSAVLTLAAVGTALVQPAVVSAAAGDLVTSGRSTYELQPARHMVRVTIETTMTNRKGGYYYFETTVHVEKDVKSPRVTIDRGSASVKLGNVHGAFRDLIVRYSHLEYRQTRKLSITYDLPAGGPRSTTLRRGGYGYADFCAYGPGTDVGTAQIIVPTGFELTVYRPMTKATKPGQDIYTTKSQKDPWKSVYCVAGSNPTAHVSTSVAAPDHGTLTIRSWRDDPTWTKAVQSAVANGFPKLAAFLGSRPDDADFTIEEHADAAGPDFWRPSTGVLGLAEQTATEEAVLHRLGLLWFDDSLFLARWMRDGYADWAIAESGAGTPACAKPGAYPGAGEPILTANIPSMKATAQERTIHAWERQAACYIVSSIADTVGQDRMREATATLRGTGTAFVAGTDGETRRLPRDWREWLDVIELRGLRPAGADVDLAASLLRTYGGANDDGKLAARRAALDAFAALTTMTGGAAPSIVTSALAEWDFDQAIPAIAAARTAWEAADSTATVLPSAESPANTIRAAVLAAKTQADLDAAVALAARQHALAVDVADALVVHGAPRDAIQELGLVGANLPGVAIALDAVSRIDVEAGTTSAAAIRTMIGTARDAGTQRLVLIAGTLVGLMLLVLLGLLVRGRRRRGRIARATAGADVVSPTSDRPPTDDPPA
jgi:hypothetical protein